MTSTGGDVDIAIIGKACRFPGARDAAAFWHNLRRGHESVTFFDDDDVRAAGVPDALLADPNYVKAGAVLEDADLFDADFFGYSARDAAILDPQHRVFIECAWQALEDAGLAGVTPSPPVGVFAGSSLSTYLLANLLAGRALDTSVDGFEMLIANDKDYLASRVSYKLGLDGPAVVVQTACSTSLVAVHLACQALLGYECDVALAGGATVRLPQRRGYLYQEGMILSPDGHCRPFDARARGTVGGNGAGAVVLKRLEDALADGDHIDAVIKGSAINNDGAMKVGYTAPSVEGQARVIAAALGAAGADPATISAIEAHGTGTPLGDPIEVAALARVFTGARPGPCAIGSVKSNIGHLDSAAGVAALIKAVLQLQHGELAPSVNFTEPNPEIDFAATPFFVNAELRPWKPEDAPRRIGVSSFGFGGTNAHVVLEEGVTAPANPPARPVHLIPLSAKSSASLDAATAGLAGTLRADAPPAVGDVAYTLQTGRAALPHRRVVVCDGRKTPADAVETPGAHRMTGRAAPDGARVAWMFPGQGSQYPGMGLGLYRTEELFRDRVDECAALFEPELGLDLRTVMFPGPDGDPAEAAARLDRTALTQPALFTVEYALARLLESWCGRPDALVGHSIGEFTAACLAGVFTLEDTVRLVAARGRLMQEQPPGSMLSVGMAEEPLRALLPPELEIAAVNAPELCAVAGPAPQVAELDRRLEESGVDHRLLHTSHAFHSAMMQPVLAPFEDEVRRARAAAPRLRYLSNRTGDWIDPAAAADPAYWSAHVRDAVRFAECARRLVEEDDMVLLEVGPGHTLTSLTRMAPGARGRVIQPAMRGAAEEISDEAQLMTALGRLWLAGADVDWPALYGGVKHRRVSLPPYAFDRRRYWITPRSAPGAAGTAGSIAMDVPAETPDALAGDVSATRPELRTEYVAPATATQRRIAAIWQDLLGVSPIGVHDHFIELGGHSLLATKIVAAVKAEFGVDVPLRELIKASTVETLAGLIEAMGGGTPAETDDALPAAVPDPEALHEPFPLSEIQQAQWIGRFADFNLGNVAAHIYWEVESTTLDLPRLGHAWNQVIDRHPMLRAIVTADGRQRILPEAGPYEIDVLDLRDAAADTVRARLDEIRERLSHEVRPAGEWPLFTVRAALLPGGRTRLFLGFDLMVADMGSVRILLRDWRALYDDPSAALPPLRISFRDYVLATERIRRTPRYERALRYWRERVTTLPPAPELPLATAPEKLTRPRFVPCSGTLPTATWDRVKERAARYGVTPSAVLLAAFAVVLGAWSRSARFTINVTTNNRLPVHDDVGGLVGGFASFNLLPVDLTVGGGIAGVARRLQEQSWADLDHRYVNGVEVLRELARSRGGTAGAVMPVVFTSTLVDGGENDQNSMVDWLGDLEYEVIQTPQVWLDAGVLEVADGLYLSWPAVEGLFPGGVQEDMFGAYVRILESLGDDEARAWEDAPRDLVPAAQAAMVRAANATAGPVPEGLLFAGIAEWAEREPARRAVFSGGRWWSFGEVYGPACRLARRLRALGVGPGRLVPVVVDKGVAQITGALGVLLAGGGYLPVDPDLPVERQEFLVAHGRARVVVTGVGGRDSWPGDVPSVVVDPGDTSDLAGGPPEQVGRPDDVAYVIYTSGSTGEPKGVTVSHRAALNTCVDVCERFGVGAEDNVLGLSSLSFDLSVWDVFGVLGVGGGLVLPETGARRDPARWLELVTGEHVTVWNSVPALMQMMADHAAGAGAELPLRLALLSGDWIPLDLPDRIRSVAAGARVVSLGGATEAAIWSIFHPVEHVDRSWESIPYGRPLRNQSFHVLDDRLEPCPVWVTGELYIGGIGLAQGYWRDPDKTAASFIIHPVTGERLYRTGDLGRWRPEGFIEFLGREDFQVKIGGFRIELGEIEAVLADHPDVAAAVAVAVGADRHHRKLAAYVVPVPDRERGPGADTELAEQVRALLGERLPSYMVPGTVTVLDRLPLTGNGKVDRSALPDPYAPDTPAAEESPVEAGPLAFRLAAIAAEVIGAGEIDPRANFFEVGGDSITGVQIAARAAAEGIELSLPDLFEARTIAAAAAIIEARQASGERERRRVPLTPLQRRLLAGAEDAGGLPGGAHWVELPVPDGCTIPPDAVRALLRRHPALRATFTREDAGWTQLVGDTDPAAAYVPVVDLRMLPEERQHAALTEMVGEMRGELDPARGPLARPALFDLADGRRLIWLVHELVADARSWEPLLRELAAMTSGTPAAGEAGADAAPRAADAFVSWSRETGDVPPHGPVPLPPRRGPAAHRAVASVPADATAETLAGALDAYRATPAETAVAAVLEAIRTATGDPAPAADVECDIRESHGLDPRATVGPLARIVTVRTGAGPAGLLPAVKRACREPAAPAAAAAPPPGLTASEAPPAGTVGPQAPAGGRAGPAGDGPAAGVLIRVIGRLGDGEGPGVPAWPVWDTHAGAPVQATVLIEGGRLHVEFTAAPGDDDARRTAEALAGALPAALATVRDHCRAGDAGGVTAADFPLAGLDEDELAAVLSDASEEGA